MANLRDIKNRIKSVKSTGKITQAMKMVAAAKVKKAENAAKESRPYSKFLIKVFAELTKSNKLMDFENNKFDSALENYPALLQKRETKNIGILVLTSDKGLAGAYNTNIIKETLQTVKDYKEQGLGVKLFVVGLKGISSLKRLFGTSGDVEIVKNYAKIPPLVEVEVAKMMAEDLAQAYVDGKIDEIEVIATEFKSMLSYKVGKFQLLPLEIPSQEDTEHIINPEMIFEPSIEEVLKKLVPLYLANSVYTALKEASASELAARMNAMSNATKNAEEMAKNLSIMYNKARQYNITQEILEVVSGANAIS